MNNNVGDEISAEKELEMSVEFRISEYQNEIEIKTYEFGMDTLQKNATYVWNIFEWFILILCVAIQMKFQRWKLGLMKLVEDQKEKNEKQRKKNYIQSKQNKTKQNWTYVCSISNVKAL